MTDEIMVVFWGKKFQVLKYFTSPARAYVRGMGRAYIFYSEMFIIGRNLTIFPVWLKFFMQQMTLYTNYANSCLKYAK